MKTIFDLGTRDELIRRVRLISEDSKPEWGKMNVYQMVKHNAYWNGWIAGKDEHFNNPGFIHDFFGKMTIEEIGVLVYKHSDHHLRQFGV